MKICSVVGTRPQFIKAAPIVRAIAEKSSFIKHIFIHSGQHYDYNMSQQFFDELELPAPNYDLEIGSGSHAEQTGEMMIALETLLLDLKPDYVLIFGDTNTTLAGALAAAKLNIPIAHVEAGLRSYNWKMPEEINRVISDRLSSLLFSPDQISINNLKNEGITKGVYHTGDVMVDQVYHIANKLNKNTNQDKFVFLTLHRQETCESAAILKEILLTLNELSKSIPIIFPVHPRVRKILQTLNLVFYPSFKICEPISYRTSIEHIKNASFVCTDSGGIQKEAYLLKTPCVTLRTETEWIDTLEFGWNQLVPLSSEKLISAFTAALTFNKDTTHPPLFGDGMAAKRIIDILKKHYD